MLGTSEDTPSLREKLHETKHSINKLVEETVARLKEENETDHLSSASTGKKLKDAKLAKDFQAVLVEFQGAQKLAQSREKSFTTSMVQSFPLPPPRVQQHHKENVNVPFFQKTTNARKMKKTCKNKTTKQVE